MEGSARANEKHIGIAVGAGDLDFGVEGIDIGVGRELKSKCYDSGDGRETDKSGANQTKDMEIKPGQSRPTAPNGIIRPALLS
jgi:hypothetical protein